MCEKFIRGFLEKKVGSAEIIGVQRRGPVVLKRSKELKKGNTGIRCKIPETKTVEEN